MTTAVQTGTTVSSAQSVAERMCREIIDLKLSKEDDNLTRYLHIWETELNDRLKVESPDQYCFSVMATARGRWAAELSWKTDVQSFPLTRKLLANRVVDGWIGCRVSGDEEFFAHTMRTWPVTEMPMLAETVRRLTEFRAPGHEGEVALRIGRFFSLSEGDMMLRVDQTLLRTMFKALGRYAPIEHLCSAGIQIYVDMIE